MTILDQLTDKVLSGEMRIEIACLKYVNQPEPFCKSECWGNLTPAPTPRESKEAIQSLSDSFLVQTVEVVKA